jgi:hypothetical protein
MEMIDHLIGLAKGILVLQGALENKWWANNSVRYGYVATAVHIARAKLGASEAAAEWAMRELAAEYGIV